jgi:hypothetical protein
MSKRFWVFTLLLVLSRSYDFAMTRIYLPDLSGETNVLVRLFGLDYTGLLVIQALLLAFVIYCYHYHVFRPYTVDSPLVRLSFREFVPYFHFRSKQPYSAFLFKKAYRSSVLYAIGYILTHSLIWIGFIVGTSTLALILSESYRRAYSIAGSVALYIILVTVVGAVAYSFYQREYRRYLAWRQESNSR